MKINYLREAVIFICVFLLLFLLESYFNWKEFGMFNSGVILKSLMWKLPLIAILRIIFLLAKGRFFKGETNKK